MDTYAHFIGIGGAGMSALALVLAERGVPVTGSDLKESRYTRQLVRAGIPVRIGHDPANLGDPEVVVVSSAIPATNPELREAERRGIPVWPRARMLAHLAADSSTIAVAGTHGKTSTSAMIATMLDALGLDPTFLVGGELAGFGTNARHGEGRFCVVEADESDGSFVELDPFVAVVTNVDADHLDHYGSMEEIRAAFRAFIERTHPDGAVVVCADDPALVELARSSGRRVVSYGFSPSADLVCERVEPAGTGSRFDLRHPAGSLRCTIAVPGEHMVSNATAALACASVLGLDLAEAARALGTYTGVRRRFDVIGVVDRITVVDDYAHHPREIDATLAAARAAGFERIWAVFQPHRYSRTAAFAAQFGRSLARADLVVITEVYSAGEAPIPGISAKTVLRALLDSRPRARAAYLPHRADIVPYVCANARGGDVVLTLGAGDITSIAPEIVSGLEERSA